MHLCKMINYIRVMLFLTSMALVLEALTVRKSELVRGSYKKRMAVEPEPVKSSLDSIPSLIQNPESESSVVHHDKNVKKSSFLWFQSQPQLQAEPEPEHEPNHIEERSNVHDRSYSRFQPQPQTTTPQPHAEPELEPENEPNKSYVHMRSDVKRSIVGSPTLDSEEKATEIISMGIGTMIRSVAKRSNEQIPLTRSTVGEEKAAEKMGMRIGSIIKSVVKRSNEQTRLTRSTVGGQKAAEKIGMGIGSMIKSVVKRSNEQTRLTEKFDELRKRRDEGNFATRSVLPDPLPGFMDHSETSEKERPTISSRPILVTNVEQDYDGDFPARLSSRNRGKRGMETIEFPPAQDPTFMSALVGSVSGPMLDSLAKLMISAGQARRELRAGVPVKKPTFYATDDLASSDNY